MKTENIAEKVNRMIACQDAETYEWMYENIVTPALCEDYDLTFAYIQNISKEHMMNLASGMDEIVEHFNKEELADLIVERFMTLIGDKGDEVDVKTIKTLKKFLR